MTSVVFETFWQNKAACDDAERAYYEKLSGCKVILPNKGYLRHDHMHKYPCKITETHSVTKAIFILYICMYYDLSKLGVGLGLGHDSLLTMLMGGPKLGKTC